MFVDLVFSIRFVFIHKYAKIKKRKQFCGTGAQTEWLFLHFLCKTSKLSKLKKKKMQITRLSTNTKYGKPNKNCAKHSEIVFAVIFRLWGWGKKTNILIGARQITKNY